MVALDVSTPFSSAFEEQADLVMRTVDEETKRVESADTRVKELLDQMVEPSATLTPRTSSAEITDEPQRQVAQSEASITGQILTNIIDGVSTRVRDQVGLSGYSGMYSALAEACSDDEGQEKTGDAE